MYLVQCHITFTELVPKPQYLTEIRNLSSGSPFKNWKYFCGHRWWHTQQIMSLQWRYMGKSNQRQLDRVFSRLCRLSTTNKTVKPLFMGSHRWHMGSYHNGPVMLKVCPCPEVICLGTCTMFCISVCCSLMKCSVFLSNPALWCEWCWILTHDI